MRIADQLQKYLSLGYLLLIVLGILQESVYYKKFGINILHYSAISDILISPIATLVSRPVIIVVGAIILILMLVMSMLLNKESYKEKLRQKLMKQNPNLTPEGLSRFVRNMLVFYFVISLVGMYVGFGMGAGDRLMERQKSNQLVYNKKLNFNNGVSEDIALIGSNSMYYFYWLNDNPKVKVAPVASVRNIEVTN
jgi:hypothetical protein